MKRSRLALLALPLLLAALMWPVARERQKRADTQAWIDTMHYYADGEHGPARTALFRELLAKGVDINTRDAGGGTALHKAVNNWDPELAHLLLQRGADVNARRKGNLNTPLLDAVTHTNLLCVRLLLVYKADVNAKNSKGLTALYLAKKQVQWYLLNRRKNDLRYPRAIEAVRLLRAAGARE